MVKLVERLNADLDHDIDFNPADLALAEQFLQRIHEIEWGFGIEWGKN